MESLKDKVVIVTGSTAGIGEATALLFSKYGCKVVITGRNVEKAKDVSRRCEEISPNKYKNLVILGDISDDSHRTELIEKTLEHFGQIDILVNNAGFSIPVNVLSDGFISAYDRVMDVNLRSPVLLTRLALPFLISSKGCVINVSSVATNRTVNESFVMNFT
ncbi:3-oxoacyl-[acyl-carrier-protein] reductase FabG-like protein [Leptotrombidium deliense]|uniref:3-oxoacyl-[acyl-carrier-protein] reductase FabG-like protein n=1 Tax=Leptotrombidium deliense TaxID=299467 RepID=A0A443SUB1_9ACAR|nr:3-oxoacyl-[acyl-carrier-protein] reductase FabG-like protein [Leptotrombidium deliense]